MTSLRVETAELRELSTKQSEAASGYGETANATSTASWSVGISHGVICAQSAMAVAAADRGRSAAATAMQKVSTKLAENLETAATHYDKVDAQYETELEKQIGTDCF